MTQTTIQQRIDIIRAIHKRFKLEEQNGLDMHWTDAPQYAEKYYGETFRETTKFDNEWG